MYFLIVCTLCAALFIYHVTTRKWNYWKNKRVPYAKPRWLLGNYGDYILQRKFYGEMLQDLCRQFPDEGRFGAFYGTEPALVVQDPGLLKLVMAKDFYYFNSREVMEHTHKEVLTSDMFFTFGDTWKVLRQNMTPPLSLAKIKSMFPLIRQKCEALQELLPNDSPGSSEEREVDVRSLMATFTMECICSCAFGIDIHALGSDANSNPFMMINDSLFDSSRTNAFKMNLRAVWPTIFYGLGLKLYPKSITDFFKEVLSKVAEERKTPSSRQDFVDLLMVWKQQKCLTGDKIGHSEESKKVTLEADEDFMIGQCVLIFGAGHETTASTMAYALYELAKNPDAQEKALAEVDAYFETHSEVEYDCVTELRYLEQCLDETLRLYPVLAVLTREVYEDYTFPDGLTLERGARVHLPVYHLQRDPKNFPDPEAFKPERFSPEGRKSIVPYTYFPFGEGPRVCLGVKFAKAVMLAGLATVLRRRRAAPAPRTPARLQLSATAMVTQCKGPLLLVLASRGELTGGGLSGSVTT